MAGRALPDYRLLNLRYGTRFEPQDMDKIQPIPSGLLGPVRLIAESVPQPQARPVHAFMIGDSTMADKKPSTEPERGWGQMLQSFFKDSVKIVNYAQNGRSSKSFIDEGLWQAVLDGLQPGDYVIIQFGHNDNKEE
jgi:lysophospholipase L1-like esterase